MQFRNSKSRVWTSPDLPGGEALARVTHLGIGAHQDDLELMAYHGIASCYERDDLWFGGVTCTDGAGSARTGAFADFTDEEMQAERRKEQEQAAGRGQYAAMIQLGYPSSAVKSPVDSSLENDLATILDMARPGVVYTHNPADKHATHIGIVIPAIRAVRSLPRDARPRAMYGCEGWRGLDWMLDEDKIALDHSAYPELADELIKLFATQVEGGKRYDLASDGRCRANATYFHSHETDTIDRLWFAMDLTPLVQDDTTDIIEYVGGYLDRFSKKVVEDLSRQLGR